MGVAESEGRSEGSDRMSAGRGYLGRWTVRMGVLVGGLVLAAACQQGSLASEPGAPKCGDYVSCSGQALPNSSYACSVAPGAACGSFGRADDTAACRSTTGSCPGDQICGYFFGTFECLEPASVTPTGDCAIDADCSAGQVCQGPDSGGYCASPAADVDCNGTIAGSWCFFGTATAAVCSLSPATEGECPAGSVCGGIGGAPQGACYSPSVCGPNSGCSPYQLCAYVALRTLGPTGHCFPSTQ